MNQPTTRQSGIVNVDFGKNVSITEPVNIYGCKIGDDCQIGPFCEIQKDVVIGMKTKVQSHTFICELVEIGHSCFIGHGVMFVNDLFRKGGPADGNKDLWFSTKIGNNVSIGSNATILAVEICDNVVIGAGSTVTRNINNPGIYAGNPARFLRPFKINQL